MKNMLDFNVQFAKLSRNKTDAPLVTFYYPLATVGFF